VESNLTSPPKGYQSVPRYLLVVFTTIFLIFPAMVVWAGLQDIGQNGWLILFLETLKTLPGIVFIQLLVGWMIWGPIALIAAIVGMPIWINALKFFAKNKLSQRISLFAATLLVVAVTTLGSDILLAILVEQPQNGKLFVFSTVFGLPAALVATATTQLLYGFD